MTEVEDVVFTVGHSRQAVESFIETLHTHGVEAIVDVRSTPFSRYAPQFNQAVLRQSLGHAGIHYVPLCEELGARSKDPLCYVDGQARYDLIAKTHLFRRGLQRVKRGAKMYKLALMCTEKDPVICHRTILVCRHLRDEFRIEHIHGDGTRESHRDLESRLLKLHNLPEEHLFSERDELVEKAYDLQGLKIAYTARTSAEVDIV
jgi:uncharacterized protein (DUF488 family)